MLVPPPTPLGHHQVLRHRAHTCRQPVMQPPQLLRDEGVACCPGLESRPLVLQLSSNAERREGVNGPAVTVDPLPQRTPHLQPAGGVSGYTRQTVPFILAFYFLEASLLALHQRSALRQLWHSLTKVAPQKNRVHVGVCGPDGCRGFGFSGWGGIAAQRRRSHSSRQGRDAREPPVFSAQLTRYWRGGRRAIDRPHWSNVSSTDLSHVLRGIR